LTVSFLLHFHSLPRFTEFRLSYANWATCTLQPLPGFRELIAELAKDFKNLTKLLLQALAIALEMPLNFFIEKHSHMLDGENENETTFR
jgi:isopenicillin N synthase-like dioxygenase